MKRILIAGKNSYVGDNLSDLLTENGNVVNVLDMIGDSWRKADFGGYDAVVAVFGIVHRKKGSIPTDVYFKINSELTFELAKYAKKAGIKQFVFFSSMSVYGPSEMVITHDTRPCPKDDYGASKLKAEELLLTLEDETFKVAIVRPPMVYGNGCKGNYNVIAKFVKKFPVFPNYSNVRSLIYIGNVCEFIKNLIDGEKNGIYLPQDATLTSTVALGEEILRANGKKMRKTKLFNPFITLAKKMGINFIRKSFGTYYYDTDSDFEHVGKYSFGQAIALSEGAVETVKENK